ncbi:unnamed protein product, partial [Symbiodinium sp. KB8]
AAAQSREQLEQRAGELKELVEQRSSESNSRMEAAKAADAEQNARVEQLARDLVDLRRGLMSEIEKCLAADRQLEDALKRSSQEVARCGEGSQGQVQPGSAGRASGQGMPAMCEDQTADVVVARDLGASVCSMGDPNGNARVILTPIHNYDGENGVLGQVQIGETFNFIARGKEFKATKVRDVVMDPWSNEQGTRKYISC